MSLKKAKYRWRIVRRTIERSRYASAFRAIDGRERFYVARGNAPLYPPSVGCTWATCNRPRELGVFRLQHCRFPSTSGERPPRRFALRNTIAAVPRHAESANKSRGEAGKKAKLHGLGEYMHLASITRSFGRYRLWCIRKIGVASRHWQLFLLSLFFDTTNLTP